MDFKKRGKYDTRTKWFQDPEGKILLPAALRRRTRCVCSPKGLLSGKNKDGRIGAEKFRAQGLGKEMEETVERCVSCTQVNQGANKYSEAKRDRGTEPGRFWEVDFTEIKPGKYKYKYLLVFVDTFCRWVEAFPTKSETAQVTVKKLLNELIPRFGPPLSIGSDNAPAFTAQVS